MPKFQALTAAAIVAAGILMTLGGQGRDPAGSALSHLGALIGQGSSEEIPRVSGRVLLLTALVFGLLAVNSFSARLISTLSVQVKKKYLRRIYPCNKKISHIKEKLFPNPKCGLMCLPGDTFVKGGRKTQTCVNI